LREHARNLGLPENSSFDDILNAAKKVDYDINMNTISPNSEAFGVFIDPRLEKANWEERQQIFRDWQAANPNGIVAYRVAGSNNYNNPAEARLGHIGNPFSKNANGPQTVQQFFDWIVTGNNFGNVDATEEYRQAIISKLKETPVGENNILYYKELGRPSHATVLGYLIQHKELLEGGELVAEIQALRPPIKVVLNPQIAKYNALNYLFTQEWLSSTVGTHMAHPSKAKFKNGYNLVEDEASRFNAQHKRNVSFTASMHEFQLNLLNGIPSVYNVSVIREVTDELYNIMGLTDDSVSPYDGATFVNPFIVYLENYSLGGAKAGMNKK
jgi:hypothetical protein